jgi:hypothetical protein
MKVLFINDSTSNPNWGDRAAAISLRMMVLQLGGDIIKTVTEDDIFCSSLGNHRIASEQVNERTTREFMKLLLPPLLLKVRRKLRPKVDAPHDSEEMGRLPNFSEDSPRKEDPMAKLGSINRRNGRGCRSR